MTNYKVSIINTTFNDLEHLKGTLNSIFIQDYDNIECIIIDGGSTDGTVDFLKEISQKNNSKIKWLSEPDNGIYDAINKGLKLATGDIIGCLFDELIDRNAIGKLVSAIENNNTDGVHADLIYCIKDKVVRYWKMGQGSIKSGWMPGFETLFLKREIYQKYGSYKTYYKCSGDYEFIVRILKDNKVRLSYIPEVLVRMSYGGTSTRGLKGYKLSLLEAYKALKENKVKFPLMICFRRTLKVLLQFYYAKKLTES